jgi:hypothetical protein
MHACMALLERTYALEGLGHDLWPVVDGQNNVRHACTSKSLNLMLDHGLVGELDERLRVSEGLHIVNPRLLQLCGALMER